MCSLLCEPSLPGWYQFFKDFIASLWASLIGLAAAFFAYKAAMAKVTYDRQSQIEQRRTCSIAMRIQIERFAVTMGRTCAYIMSSSKEGKPRIGRTFTEHAATHTFR